MLNRPLRLFLIPLCLFSLSLAAADTISSVVSQVSVTSYRHYLDDLLYTHNGDNRGIGGAQHDLARTNIYNEFVSFGLNTTLNAFTYGGGTYYNVVAVHPGRDRPDDIYLVGAHYDSANTPGADDNGSGVAGMLEMARVISTRQLEATVIFIAFDREEQGLIGSRAYAAAHADDDILGMVSLDMLGYNPVGTHYNRAYIYGDNAFSAWKSKLAGAVATYSGGVTAQIAGALDQSDHAPFEDYGKPAALLIEHAVWNNPYYHKATDSVDTPGYIDYVYATALTRSVAGLLLEEGRMITPEPGTVGMYAVVLVAFLVVLRRRQGGDPRSS